MGYYQTKWLPPATRYHHCRSESDYPLNLPHVESIKHNSQLCANKCVHNLVVTCLGVVIDSQLTFTYNVKKLAGSCFYQLGQLS